jgi:hypothetical protein
MKEKKAQYDRPMGALDFAFDFSYTIVYLLSMLYQKERYSIL